jgi:ferredoxin
MSAAPSTNIRNASITKDNLLRLLDNVVSEKTLIAPTCDDRYEDVNFLPVSSIDQIWFDYTNTPTSPKEFFLPQSECMFTFANARNKSIRLPAPAEEIVVFGIRSCDVKALELLDKFYTRNFEDNYYLDKRKKSVLISVACSQLDEQCFCTATETGPVLRDGFDIQLLDAGGVYAVQVGSETGLALFSQYQSFFGPPVQIDIEAVIAEIRKQRPKFDLRKVYANLKDENVSEAFWQDVADRCQSCGLCLFLCPTCSCYSVTDRLAPTGENRRERQWDACYFKGMTCMTDHNNPIRSSEEMVKRKYVHKLLQQIDEFAMSGCTGCGRCNLCCVGNVNWLENVIKIEKGA